MNENVYPEGLDCVWIASDPIGHVAAFVTAGKGPIPKKAFDCATAIEDIEEALNELQDVSGAELHVEIKRPDDFIAIARKGLFVYDWRDVHRAETDCSYAYEPIASPHSPIVSSELPTHLRIAAESVRFEKMEFAGDANADVLAQFETYRSST